MSYVRQTCQATDCFAEAMLPSGFCSKRCYHRQYRRDHSEDLNASQRQHYAEDEAYREALASSNATYAATDAGKDMRQRARARHKERDPDYHVRYAQEHSAEAVERARQWRLANPEAFAQHMRIHSVNRRAQKFNQFIENIDPQTVYEMNGGMCGICEGFIEGEFHVDHVIPLSKGGMHGYINVQPAHPRCNVRKGARV